MPITPSPPSLGTRSDRALRRADELCKARLSRLTDLRAAVLRCVAESSGPIGAYRILDGLKAALGRPVAPPTVYRALDFLLEVGLIARVESRSAYVLRENSDADNASVLFLCHSCDRAIEVENADLARLITQEAASLGFKPERPVIECSGTCTECAELERHASGGTP